MKETSNKNKLPWYESKIIVILKNIFVGTIIFPCVMVLGVFGQAAMYLYTLVSMLRNTKK